MHYNLQCIIHYIFSTDLHPEIVGNTGVPAPENCVDSNFAANCEKLLLYFNSNNGTLYLIFLKTIANLGDYLTRKCSVLNILHRLVITEITYLLK